MKHRTKFLGALEIAVDVEAGIGSCCNLQVRNKTVLDMLVKEGIRRGYLISRRCEKPPGIS